MIAAVVGITCIGPAFQPAMAGPGEPADSARIAWHRWPSAVMARSALVPGWGQWTNGRHRKAVLVASGQVYLAYRALKADREEEKARDRAVADPEKQEHWLQEARFQADRRHDFTWWSLFALFLSMGDAYVDAHLGRFDAEWTPQSLAVGLTWRLP